MTTCCTPSTTTAPAAATHELPLRKPRYSTAGTDTAYTVKVELPGVAKDAVTIDFDQSVLTIQAPRKTVAPEAWKPLHRELNDLGYALRLRLNAPIDEDKVSAQFADGVLTVTLPIRETAKPRQIAIN
jgi:HSP20 family protein